MITNKEKKNKEIKIVQKGEAVLRQIATLVAPEEIKTPKIQKVIADMKTALATQPEGVALAAPQIGTSLRIFIVSKRMELLTTGDEKLDDKADLEKIARQKKLEDVVYINPVFKKISRTKFEVDEGCLSVRNFYGKVVRSEKATVEAYNESGKKFIKGASGLLAQAFQHEIDHLNGILFIDKATDLVEIKPKIN